jgi:hypothetical protein
MRPELEFVFELRGTLDPAYAVGATPHGLRRMVPITGGVFEGPKLRGSIVPGGADWQVMRGDGVSELEALYLLRTHDDVLIQVRNRGLRHGPEAVMRRLFAGEPVDPREYYFRAVPSFAAPAGEYEWLNRSVFLCSGARQANSLQLWIYRVV